MLRPATPLAVLLFAAFAMLLVSVLSTPIIQVIPLGTFKDVNFGVFGFCKGSNCSPIEIGYDTSRIFQPDDPTAFDLPSSARTTLSSTLVIHPVAALMTLAMFVLAVVAHFHSPSHSARYLLLLFIISILDFLACLLAFLIDVLLFVPHLAWGSYLVLAAAILVALSSLVSCAMRRTIVSRKARQKRIAQNAEMSGENFYNRQGHRQSDVPNITAAPPPTTRQPTVPVISGANGSPDGLPEFASFEKKDDMNIDDRVPLTSRSPSDRRSPALPPPPPPPLNDMAAIPVGPPRRSLSAPPVQFDQYGNPIAGPPEGYGVRRGASFERMNSRGRGGMPPGYRGRGGSLRGGGYNGYGPPPPGRGGYAPPPRGGGYGGGPRGGGYGPPPRGYGSMRGGRPPPGYQNAPYDRRPSPGGGGYPGPYGARQPSPGPPSAPAYANPPNNPNNPNNPNGSTATYEAYNPDRRSLPRAESPPPLPEAARNLRQTPPLPPTPQQVAELDAAPGSLRRPTPPSVPQGQYGIRDSDADVEGMLALQQGKGPVSRARGTMMSDVSRYSQDDGTYLPPRQAWNQGTGRSSPGVPAPLKVSPRNPEVPPGLSPVQPQPSPAGEYYEDVDPRFADPPTTTTAPKKPTPPPIQTTNSYEDIPPGERSPAESDFTSISQRGINPRWNPPPPPPRFLAPGGYAPPPRRNVNRDDVLLQSNPDFELPTGRKTPRNAGGGRMIPGSAYPAGPL